MKKNPAPFENCRIRPMSTYTSLKDWSLMTERGRGACEVLPLRKRGGGGGQSFSHAEGGGDAKVWPLFKRGGGRKKFYPVLRGGGANIFGSAIFPFCTPPPPPSLPVINDQSLRTS